MSSSTPFPFSDEAFERQYQEATERGRITDQAEPRAVSARYDRKARQLIVELKSGACFMAPIALFQGLTGQSDDDLAEIELTPGGTALHWPRLDCDFGVPEMLAGTFGFPSWMKHLRAEWAKQAGSVKSPSKTAAARANGKLGGRPRKPEAELSPRQLARRRAAEGA